MQSCVLYGPGLYALEVYGGSGGGPSNGYGGYSLIYYSILSDITIYICCGGAGDYANQNQGALLGGYNGGGTVNHEWSSDEVGGGGGGATHIATTNRGVLANYNSYRSEVIVVAGGGGGGYWGVDYGTKGGFGGHGGGLSGTRGGYNTFNRTTIEQAAAGYYAAPGTQSSGYAFGQGGSTIRARTGGGGGGWYGGTSNESTHWGGGGGSGYIKHSSITYNGASYSSSSIAGLNSGNGYARVTFVA